MNVERLHVIARALRSELDSKSVVSYLQNLVNTAQQLSANPNNASIQQNFVNAKETFLNSVTDVPSDSFPPAWKKVLVELGGADLFGQRLKERVEQILSEHQVTLSVGVQKLSEILSTIQNFQQNLSFLTDAFSRFKIGFEQLAPGEAEIGVTIPRAAIHNKFAEFTDELGETKFILDTFYELATGHVEDLDIKAVASSDLTIYLAAPIFYGVLVAQAVNFIVGEYKKILEIKKLQLEIERLGAPDDVAQGTRKWAKDQMEAAIESFTPQLMEQHRTVTDGGRRNELSNKVNVALRKIAVRIDLGFSFEVRAEAPSAAEKDGTDEAARDAKVIKDAAKNLQFIRAEGPPILTLPESVDQKPEPPRKPTRASRKNRPEEPSR